MAPGAYAPLTVTYDAVPLDEVEVCRGDHVFMPPTATSGKSKGWSSTLTATT